MPKTSLLVLKSDRFRVPRRFVGKVPRADPAQVARRKIQPGTGDDRSYPPDFERAVLRERNQLAVRAGTGRDGTGWHCWNKLLLSLFADARYVCFVLVVRSCILRTVRIRFGRQTKFAKLSVVVGVMSVQCWAFTCNYF